MATENLRIEDLDISKPHEESGRIEFVAVVGGGIMGRGIAQTIAASGIDVLIVEISEEVLKNTLDSLREDMDREIQRWAMTKGEQKSILSRIKGTINLNDIKMCDLIVEAVDEDLKLKQEIFKKMDAICDPDTIFVSNTATLSLSDIAKITKRPDKIIGMHFLNPVPKIPLIEVVRALKTSENTVQVVKKFGEKLNKTVVETNEYPGFATTRIIVPLLNEAMYVLMEGVASAEGIDTAVKLGYNLPMGPLEMADTMGLDEVFNWMESLRITLGDIKYRPCPILRRMVREGKLGKKSGEGFFKYDENNKRISQL
jgi:3-hydroxybutyryl-CoA dehydrogenase